MTLENAEERRGTEVWWDALVGQLELWRQENAPGVPSVTELAVSTGRDPWTVLASTILSLRTKDEVTLASSKRLLAAAPDPQALLDLDAETIEKLIFPVGFFRTKTRSLRGIASILLNRYGGRVPKDRDRLLDLPGVGLKTANLVLAEAFGVDAICVDTHVHRIANRLGAVRRATAEATEEALRASLPRRYWRIINPLLVLYGQMVCRPIGPRCDSCHIALFCQRVGLERRKKEAKTMGKGH